MNLTVVTGGARSGKSAFAEKLAMKRGGLSVCYVATAEALDEEMAARIDAHRAQRPDEWLTIEEPRRLAAILEFRKNEIEARKLVVIECITLYVSNLLIAHSEAATDRAIRDEVQARIRELLAALSKLDVPIIAVTNEVGFGIVPANRLGRLFQDLLGWANRQFAEAASDVYLLIAGIALPIKTKAQS